MAMMIISQMLITFKPKPSICNRLFSTSLSHFHHHHPLSPPPPPFNFNTTPTKKFLFPSPTLFSTSPENEIPKKPNTKVNFSLSDSDSDSDSDAEDSNSSPQIKEIDKTKLPPPYDPFSKKSIIEEPDDPKNLQQVFHKIRTDGLTNNAVKMFDALSKDGLTHEALELFAQIKDKGSMPDVVAHTAVIEAYVNAGQAKEAHKVYTRMLACGVMPNAYTYTVLIKGLAVSGDAKLLGEGKKCLVEMMWKKIRPNAGTCVSVLEAFAKNGKEEEDGRDLVKEMKGFGFVPDEKGVKEALRDKRGPVFRSVMNLLFAK